MKLQDNHFKHQTVESLNHKIEIYTLTIMPASDFEMPMALFMEFDMFVPHTLEDGKDTIHIIYTIRFGNLVRYYTREHEGTQQSAFSEIVMLAESELDSLESSIGCCDLRVII